MTLSTMHLGDLTKIRTGKLDANASSENGKYPFFTCAGQPLRIDSFSYDCECVLVAGNGDLNVKYYEGKFDAYQRTYIVEARPESKGDLDLRYVYHFLENYLETLREQSVGGIIKYIKLGNLAEAPIPLPPLAEQKRIAGILDAADALRAKRREALAQLDTLLQSTFLDMFGDPVTNPMGWEKPSLEELCEKVIDCPHSTPRWSESGVICLRTSNLGKGEWIWDDTRFVTEKDYKERTKRSEILPNDIILSREGTVGVLALVADGMRLCMGQRLVQLRVIESKLHPKFLLHLLLHDLAPERLSRLMAGSTSKHLNVRELRKLPVFRPPLDLQHRFAAIVESIEQQKANQRAHLAELDTLFASLQSRAFRGEL
ncbi:MAG: restriction endonuclease subunit S [Pseudomonadales bacterium]